MPRHRKRCRARRGGTARQDHPGWAGPAGRGLCRPALPP